MALATCRTCGHEIGSADAACPKCSQAPMNGVVPLTKPAAPSEVSSWILHETTPELLEWAKQTCNEEEFSAALREVQQTGGMELNDFIHELEDGAPTRD